MKNIVLIGMPACGKSTVGVLLAKTLGMGFVDTDLLIQQRECRLLQQIIDESGLDYFLDAERDAILSMDAGAAVIATGGSAVFREEAMQKLKETGIVVYLDVPLEQILLRLDNIKTRGVASRKGMSIAEIYAQREPYYRRYADCVISIDSQSIEQTVSQILASLS